MGCICAKSTSEKLDELVTGKAPVAHITTETSLIDMNM